MKSLTTNFSAKIYGPQRVAAVVDALHEEGVAKALALAGSELEHEDLCDPRTTISYQQLILVFRNALRLSRNSSEMAFRAGARAHITAFGMYGYGLLSSTAFPGAMEFALKYNRIIGPVATPASFEIINGQGVISYEVPICAEPKDDLYRFALEFGLSAHLRMGRDLYGEDYGVAGLKVRFPRPKDLRLYDQNFNCPIKFSQAHDQLIIGAPWISAPLPLSDQVTHGLIGRAFGKMLQDFPDTPQISPSVRNVLRDLLPARRATIEYAASSLATHPRTLRRRLEAEGTSFRSVLAQVREELAIEYLHGTHLTIEGIAERLGYSDSSNFRHAFARWTGRCPGDYRSQDP